MSFRMSKIFLNLNRKKTLSIISPGTGLLLSFVIIVYFHYLEPDLDKSISLILTSRMTQTGNIIFGLVSDLGDLQLIVPFSLALLAYFLWKRNWLPAAGLIFCVFGGGLFTNILKYLFQQPGTDILHTNVLNGDFGFPSGHTVMGILFYGYLAINLANKSGDKNGRWVYLACAGFIAFLIGLSRLLIGVHLPSDVLAGWIIGLTWLSISHVIFKRIGYLI